eukprot:scaffold7337_cov220-Pinguiococcus_pyrenoidosus.AAC.4
MFQSLFQILRGFDGVEWTERYAVDRAEPRRLPRAFPRFLRGQLRPPRLLSSQRPLCGAPGRPERLREGLPCGALPRFAAFDFEAWLAELRSLVTLLRAGMGLSLSPR